MTFWVYMLASGKNGTLCVGSTDAAWRDLANDIGPG